RWPSHHVVSRGSEQPERPLIDRARLTTSLHVALGFISPKPGVNAPNRSSFFMEQFLQRLQDSDFGMWVAGADTIWAFPMIITMHTVGLAMIVGPNAVLDLRL